MQISLLDRVACVLRRASEWRVAAAVFGVAFTIRVAVAVGVTLFMDGSLIFDDATYSKIAAEKANGLAAGWDPYTESLYRATATFLVPLTALYEVFGHVEVAGRILVAAVGAACVMFIYVLVRAALGRAWGLFAAALLALLPSQILFSSVTLKDAFVWACLAGLAVLVGARSRSTNRDVLITAVGAAVILVLLGHLRDHTLVVAAAALALTGWVGAARKVIAGAAVVLVCVVVPWSLGMGPAGLNAVPDQEYISSYRASQATGGSAVADTDADAHAAADADADTAYDEPDRSRVEVQTSALERNLRRVPRGVSVYLFEPLPWHSSSSTKLRLAQVENVVWYPLLMLAAVGIAGSRRYLGIIAFPTVFAAGAIVVASVAEGNIGTAFRHRGEIVWVVVLLATLGAATVTSQWKSKKSAVDGEGALPVVPTSGVTLPTVDARREACGPTPRVGERQAGEASR